MVGAIVLPPTDAANQEAVVGSAQRVVVARERAPRGDHGPIFAGHEILVLKLIFNSKRENLREECDTISRPKKFSQRFLKRVRHHLSAQEIFSALLKRTSQLHNCNANSCKRLSMCTVSIVDITFRRVWINRVRLPILLVVSSCSRLRVWFREPFRPASACSCSTPRLNLMLTQGNPPAFQDGIHRYCQPPSGQSHFHQVPQLSRTDGTYRRESTGTRPVFIVSFCIAHDVYISNCFLNR